MKKHKFFRKHLWSSKYERRMKCVLNSIYKKIQIENIVFFSNKMFYIFNIDKGKYVRKYFLDDILCSKQNNICERFFIFNFSLLLTAIACIILCIVVVPTLWGAFHHNGGNDELSGS